MMKLNKNKMLAYCLLLIGVGTLPSCEETYGPMIPLPPLSNTVEGGARLLAMADQQEDKAVVVNVSTGERVWEWNPQKSNIPDSEKPKFTLLDEVKPIYNCKYLLITATRGGVAIVRMSDSKLMFYALPMGYPHSAEVLPDGNVVVACSDAPDKLGNKLKLYEVDSTAVYSEEPIGEFDNFFAHNAVWDREHFRLWTTADDKLLSWAYEKSGGKMALVPRETFALPDRAAEAHDLFPVYGEKGLWVTTVSAVYKFDVTTKTFTKFSGAVTNNIKSISSGPKEYPIVLLAPNKNYWSDRVIDSSGRTIYMKPNAKIYKARWMLQNAFSYPDEHAFTQSR